MVAAMLPSPVYVNPYLYEQFPINMKFMKIPNAKHLKYVICKSMQPVKARHCIFAVACLMLCEHLLLFLFWGSASCCAYFIKVIRTTTTKGVYFLYFWRYMFRPLLPSSGGIYNYFKKLLKHKTKDPL
jgi:hypothetical protein